MSTATFQRKAQPVQRRPFGPSARSSESAATRSAGSPGPAPRLSRPLSSAGTGHPVQLKTEITHHKGTYNYGKNNAKSETVGMAMEAKLDPTDPKTGSGTDASVQEEMMAWVSSTYGGSWVKGHLLNDNLGGRAIAENLYPITSSANGQHKNQVENHVKNLLAEETTNKTNQPIFYDVDVLPEEGGAATFHCNVWVGSKDNQVSLSKNIYSIPGVRGAEARDTFEPMDEEDDLYGSKRFPTVNLPQGWGAVGTGKAGGNYNKKGDEFLDEKGKHHADIY